MIFCFLRDNNSNNIDKEQSTIVIRIHFLFELTTVMSVKIYSCSDFRCYHHKCCCFIVNPFDKAFFKFRNKTCSPAFIAWWKPRRTFRRIREQISENPRRSREFSPAREFSQTLPRFSPGYEGTDNMFYFFYKIIIFYLKGKLNPEINFF